MGLDMYLERFPRYKYYTAEDICNVESYLEWLDDPKGQQYTLEDWCGVKQEQLPKAEDIEYFKRFMGTKYYAWDEDKKYPTNGIREHVAYWRKANAVHKWFVENVQDREDDCDYHREVREEDLVKLRDICRRIIEETVLIKGKVKNGYRFEKNKEVPIYEDGLLVANPQLCNSLLPCTDGFFFGSTEYNEWYLDDIKYTYEVCNEILKDTDFEKQMIFYRSSW